MKQNYKIYLCSLLLVGAVNTMTVGALGADKPKLAVLVVGMLTDAEGDEFAAGLGSELTQNGAYKLATKTNNTAVATKLAALRTQHAGGAKVDITSLAAWGKANGIGFVQLVVESTIIAKPDASTAVAGREQVAQLVDCSTGQLLERGTYRKKFGSPVELTLQLASVTGGVFEMGCKSGRDGTCNSDETLHWVRVNNFHITKYEVTQAQWKAVMGSLPSNLSGAYVGDSKPVIYVSHDDIVGAGGFLEKLNALTGQRWRLPTEAEWEYAARGCSAGNCERYTYSGSNTIENVAWYSSNHPTANPQPVGGKLPNKLGIYDMSGNVWEWCSDWYGSSYYPSGTTRASSQVNPTGPEPDSYRVRRGGSWDNGASSGRVAYRDHNTPSGSTYALGFRLVLP
jgi:formylglycine-generating enzyme required for sulfatase activity